MTQGNSKFHASSNLEFLDHQRRLGTTERSIGFENARGASWHQTLVQEEFFNAVKSDKKLLSHVQGGGKSVNVSDSQHKTVLFIYFSVFIKNSN